jgi:hypothetical protein
MFDLLFQDGAQIDTLLIQIVGCKCLSRLPVDVSRYSRYILDCSSIEIMLLENVISSVIIGSFNAEDYFMGNHQSTFVRYDVNLG